MKIQTMLERGYKREGDFFRLRNERGNVVSTYHHKKCQRCNEWFAASHRPQMFCSNKCQLIGNSYCKGTKFNRPKKHKLLQHGYVWVYEPSHPKANNRGYVAEHRFVMEQKIGRILESHEFVHHISHNKADNRIENLVITNISEHNSIHKSEEVLYRKRDDSGRFL